MSSDYNVTLEDLQVPADDAIRRRIHHYGFASILLWLDFHFRHNDHVYTRDLEGFFKVSSAHAYKTLRSLCNMGLLLREKSSVVSAFKPTKDDKDQPVFKQWLKEAAKTVGQRK